MSHTIHHAPPRSLPVIFQDGKTALVLAMEKEHAEVLSALVSNRPEVLDHEQVRGEHMPPLHMFAGAT